MNTKKTISIVSIIIIFVLLAIGLSALGDGEVETGEDSEGIVKERIEEFITETRAEVVSQIGQPIEGFEPFMFLQVYPNLEETDFDGVKALMGHYEYRNGELVYVSNNDQPVHSAAQTISDAGMVDLLVNISQRFNIDLEEAEVGEIIEAIEGDQEDKQVNTGSGISVDVEGEIVCLPHKDTSGPQTLECALGLLADSGEYYGITSPDQHFPPELRETGRRVRISGEISPPAPDNRYNVVGIIVVETIAPDSL